MNISHLCWKPFQEQILANRSAIDIERIIRLILKVVNNHVKHLLLDKLTQCLQITVPTMFICFCPHQSIRMIPAILRTGVFSCHLLQVGCDESAGNERFCTGTRFYSRAAWYKLYFAGLVLYFALFPLLIFLLPRPIKSILRTNNLKCIAVHTHTHVSHILFKHYYWRMPGCTIYKNINGFTNAMSLVGVSNYTARAYAHI